MFRQKNGIWKVTDAEMNDFICMMLPASERYRQLGCPALARNALRVQSEIYATLDGVGYYDNCESHKMIKE